MTGLTGHRALAALTAVGVLASGTLEGGQFPRGVLRDASKGCTIDVRTVAFGEYDTVDSRPLDGQGLVTYTCGDKQTTSKSVKEAVTNIRIEISRGGAGSFDRAMFGGSERLHYNVYLDAQRQVVWGDGSSGTDYYFDPHPPNKQPVTVPIYGRVFPLQDIAVGEYSDTLTVTIQF